MLNSRSHAARTEVRHSKIATGFAKLQTQRSLGHESVLQLQVYQLRKISMHADEMAMQGNMCQFRPCIKLSTNGNDQKKVMLPLPEGFEPSRVSPYT